MPGLYRDQGVVLRTVKLGEADRIVSFLTQGHGKVRAVAKGVRKSGSRFGARLEPTSHVALQCYRGRELDVVTQVETIDAYRPLRESYACFTHAVPMLEAVDQVAQEREPAPALYRMLVGALRTLERAAVAGRHPGVLLEAAQPRRLPPVPGGMRPVRGGGRSVHRVRSRGRRDALRDLRPPRRSADRPGGARAPGPARRRGVEPGHREPAGPRARARDRTPRRPDPGVPLRAPPPLRVLALKISAGRSPDRDRLATGGGLSSTREPARRRGQRGSERSACPPSEFCERSGASRLFERMGTQLREEPERDTMPSVARSIASGEFGLPDYPVRPWPVLI